MENLPFESIKLPAMSPARRFQALGGLFAGSTHDSIRDSTHDMMLLWGQIVAPFRNNHTQS